MRDKEPMVLVVDGQGGGVGRSLVERLRERFPQLHIRAVGTNSTASAAMLKAGADEAATGENAVVFNAARAEVILGPVAILTANGLMGEVTPAMAEAVGSAAARKIVIPSNRCNISVAGVAEAPLRSYLDQCLDIVRAELDLE